MIWCVLPINICQMISKLVRIGSMQKPGQWIYLPATIVSFVLVICCINCNGNNLQSYNEPIEYSADVFEDATNALKFEEVIVNQNKIQFRPLARPLENFGGTKSTFWVRVNIKTNQSPLFLEVDYAPLSSVTFYKPISDLEYSYDQKTKFQKSSSGRSIPFNRRSFRARTHILKIIKPESGPVYIKIQSSLVVIGLKLRNESDLKEYLSNETIAFSIYSGFVLAMLLYNLFIWLSIHDLSYLFYVCFVGFLAFHQFVYFGLAFMTIWPESPLIEDRAYSILSATTVLFALCFVFYFLDIRNNVSELTKIFKFSIVLAIGIGVTGFFVPRSDLLYLLVLQALSTVLLVVVAMIWAIIRGVRAARFFLIASGFSTLAVVMFTAPMFELIPATFLSQHSLIIGSALETLLLSMALADRINILRQEKSRALDREHILNLEIQKLLKLANQLSTVTDAPAAVNVTFDHLQNWKPDLFKEKVEIILKSELSEKRRVQHFQYCIDHVKNVDGTSIDFNTLVSTSRQLTQPGDYFLGRNNDIVAIIKFKNMILTEGKDKAYLESVLDSLTLTLETIRSANEKRLVILGGFATGIVHDIKNDITAARFCLDALGNQALHEDQKVKLVKDANESLLELFEKVQDALNFIRGNHGISIVKIETDEFVKLLKARLKPVFLHQNQILKIDNRLPQSINIDTRRIIRVILNIAHNASRAMDENGIFSIDISQDENDILFCLSDTGPGIPESIQSQMFIPFGINSHDGGYGLGLAITRSIIEEHSGTIGWENGIESGAKFWFRLPLV